MHLFQAFEQGGLVLNAVERENELQVCFSRVFLLEFKVFDFVINKLLLDFLPRGFSVLSVSV